MKKILGCFLTLVMSFSLVAYGGATLHAQTVSEVNNVNNSESEIPIELVFYNDSNYMNNLILLGNSIFAERGFTGKIATAIDLKTKILKSGSYALTFDVADLSSNKYFYEMGGNIYDKQNHISLPTKWTEKDNIITAEFTITNTTNRLSLGEGGMYIEINEPSLDHRLVMSITLEKR